VFSHGWRARFKRSSEFQPKNTSFCLLNNADVATLLPDTWLRDVVIDTFLHVSALLFTRKGFADGRAPVTVFDSHFMTAYREGLRDADWKSSRMYLFLSDPVKSQIPLDQMFASDIVMPIHVDGNHWILALIPRRSQQAGSPCRTIYVLDPFQNGVQRTSLMDHLVRWLAKHFPDDAVEQVFTPPGLPCQTDSVNCGVYVSMYAYHWMERGTLPTAADFKAVDCAAFRTFMAHTLLSAADAYEGIHTLFPRRVDLPAVYLAMPTNAKYPFNTSLAAAAPARPVRGRGAPDNPINL
jgi:Ulp1 family protease